MVPARDGNDPVDLLTCAGLLRASFESIDVEFWCSSMEVELWCNSLFADPQSAPGDAAGLAGLVFTFVRGRRAGEAAGD